MKLFIYHLTLFFLILPVNLQAEHSDIPPFTASYEIRINKIKVAELQRQLKKEQNHEFLFETFVETAGIARLFKKDITTERSHFRIKDGQLIPSNYFYHRERKKKNKKIEIQFDSDKNQFTSVINGDNRKITYTPPVLDKLSSQFDLMYKLSNGNLVSMQNITNGKEVKEHHLIKLSDEILDFNGQKNPTEKWQRQVVGDQDKTILWLSPMLKYLPIKLEIYEQGEDVVSVQLTTTSLMDNQFSK